MKKQIFAAAAMITAMGLSACQAQNETGSVAQTQNEVQTGTDAGHGIFDIPVELEYAQKFTIAKDGDGCSLLTIDQGDPGGGDPGGKFRSGDTSRPRHGAGTALRPHLPGFHSGHGLFLVLRRHGQSAAFWS